MKEIWKDVLGYEGIYKVSDMGNIKSLTRRTHLGQHIDGRIMKQPISSTNGYRTIVLSKDGKQRSYCTHSIVMKAFKGLPSNGEEVMHLDGVRSNPELSNLTYGSRSCNQAFRVDDGTTYEGQDCHFSKITTNKAIRIKEFLFVGIRQIDIANMMGISKSCVSHIACKRTWKHLKEASYGRCI